MTEPLHRRDFLGVTASAGLALGLSALPARAGSIFVRVEVSYLGLSGFHLVLHAGGVGSVDGAQRVVVDSRLDLFVILVDIRARNGMSRLQVWGHCAITRLRSPQQRLLVWDWFRIAGRDVVNPYVAKAMLAWQKLSNRGDDGTAIILATPYDDHSQPPVEVLREFALDMMPSINAALARVEADIVASGR